MKNYIVILVLALMLSACASTGVSTSQVAKVSHVAEVGKEEKTASTEKLYCERTTGSRLERKKVCYTEEQRKFLRESARTAVTGMQQGVVTEKQ